MNLLACIQLVAAMALGACVLSPAPRPPHRLHGAGCEAACERMRDLRCELGETTPAGFSCEEVCDNTREISESLWDTECLAAAPTCDACDDEEDAP